MLGSWTSSTQIHVIRFGDFNGPKPCELARLRVTIILHTSVCQGLSMAGLWPVFYVDFHGSPQQGGAGAPHCKAGGSGGRQVHPGRGYTQIPNLYPGVGFFGTPGSRIIHPGPRHTPVPSPRVKELMTFGSRSKRVPEPSGNAWYPFVATSRASRARRREKRTRGQPADINHTGPNCSKSGL